MKTAFLVEAMDHLDPALLRKYFKTEEKMTGVTRSRRLRVAKRWMLAVASFMLAMGIIYGVSYIPVSGDRIYENYRYYDSGDKAVVRKEGTRWVYYVGELGVMRRERVKMFANIGNVFGVWRSLNGIGEEVKVLSWEVEDNHIKLYDENGKWEGWTIPEDYRTIAYLTVSEEIKNYKNYEKLLRSLELTILDYNDECYITVE